MKTDILIALFCISPAVVIFVDFLDMLALYNINITNFALLLKKVFIDPDKSNFYMQFLYQTLFILVSYCAILIFLYAKRAKT